MNKNQEKEFKWDASPRGAFARFLPALREAGGKTLRARKLQLTDYYLQDEKNTLAVRKIALRIRRTGKRFEATLKNRSRLCNGLAVRREDTLPLLGVSSWRQALKKLAERGKWQEIDTQHLHVHFIIKNARNVYAVKYAGCECEAALDNYVTYARGHRLRRKEIELELKKGSAKDFEKLIKNITAFSGLCAAKISKVAGAEKWIKEQVSLN